MKATLRLFAAAAVVALCFVASATASTSVATPGVGVKAVGTVRTHDWKGDVTGFRLYYGITKSPRLIYTAATGKVIFRSLTLKAAASGPKAVRFVGTGLANGKRVPFHAVVVMHTLDKTSYIDRFGVAWNHGALFGGHLLSGAVRISYPLRIGGGSAPTAY